MSNDNSEKRKALEAAMGQIEKQFGKGSIMKLGDFQAMNIEAISTGALSLDVALGIGGLPRGRIIEIFGPESSGLSLIHIYGKIEKITPLTNFYLNILYDKKALSNMLHYNKFLEEIKNLF